MKQQNYTKEFDEWFEAEKKNGLVDVKFFKGDVKDSTVDTFAKEALDVLRCEKSSTLPRGF